MVVGAAREIVREAEHVGDFFREVVGVFVAVAVAEIFHKASGGIAHMERHGIGLGFVDVVEDFAVGGVDGVGFGCERKVDGGFGEGEVAFGRTEEIEGVFGRERHGQGVGVGRPDVFAGHAHHAAREVERIFAGFDHAREPIEGGVRIGVAHGFVERGDEIEMLFPGFVVAEEFALENVFEEFAGDDPSGAFLDRKSTRLNSSHGYISYAVFCLKKKKNISVTLLIAFLPYPAFAQKSTPPSPAQVAQEVREYRMDNEDRIIRELSEFLSIPNIASDTLNIQKNAARLVEMLEARGIETHLLPISGRGPVVFGKLIAPEAKRTVIFYAHYDGQPVDPAAWTDGKPFEPVLRDGAIEAGGKRIPFPENSAQHRAVYDDNWRIYARSSSDDKSPIVALLAAIDALRAKKVPLAVNLKLVLEGEEEAGSPNLQRTLELHQNLLGGDLLITGDGPVHQSGRPLVFFGNRGILGFEITTFGPIRALHSGHYGNWAPNPGFHLARLLASMKSDDGRVLIEGFYDDVVPLGNTEKKALEEMPNNDEDLERELQFAKPEGGGKRLVELLQLPSLNIRGLRSAYVGEQAQNVVPEKAEAALAVRLVKGEDPDKKFEQVLAHIRKHGFYVTSAPPTREERLSNPHVVRVVKDVWNYRASRTSMELSGSKALVQLVQDTTGGSAVVAPTLGGSVPMYIFEDLGLPWIGVPMVNYDNHQHSSDENLRLGHFWRGMEIYGAILADLNW